MKFLVLAALVMMSIPAFSATCPLGEGETQLTIKRVMYDFRDHLDMPDTVSQNGLSNPTGIATADLQNAASEVAITVACADAVLAKDSDALVPDDAKSLQGDAKAKYLDVFYAAIGHLHDALLTYQQMFEKMITEDAAARDFKSLHDQSLEIRAIETDGHDHT